MPYRRSADSLARVLEDAIEAAMAPAGEIRRADLVRLIERVDDAIAMASAAAQSEVASLRQVRDVLVAKARGPLSVELPPMVTPDEERAARASPRGTQLRIIEVTLNEVRVRRAEAVVRALVRERAALPEAERKRLADAVAILRDRYHSAKSLLQLATLEACSDRHARLLNPWFDRLDDDLHRVAEAARRGKSRLGSP